MKTCGKTAAALLFSTRKQIAAALFSLANNPSTKGDQKANKNRRQTAVLFYPNGGRTTDAAFHFVIY
jgi:hypothetical protein